MQWLTEPIDGYTLQPKLGLVKILTILKKLSVMYNVYIPNKDHAQGKVLSVAEGFTAVTRHAAGEKHKVCIVLALSVVNWHNLNL